MAKQKNLTPLLSFSSSSPQLIQDGREARAAGRSAYTPWKASLKIRSNFLDKKGARLVNYIYYI